MISQSDLLNYHCSVANRRAAYLAGTSRSVGRGWPLKATSYPGFWVIMLKLPIGEIMILQFVAIGIEIGDQ
jgi:hypothetical protein